jgi:hypothetical protein
MPSVDPDKNPIKQILEDSAAPAFAESDHDVFQAIAAFHDVPYLKKKEIWVGTKSSNIFDDKERLWGGSKLEPGLERPYQKGDLIEKDDLQGNEVLPGYGSERVRKHQLPQDVSVTPEVNPVTGEPDSYRVTEESGPYGQKASPKSQIGGEFIFDRPRFSDDRSSAQVRIDNKDVNFTIDDSRTVSSIDGISAVEAFQNPNLLNPQQLVALVYLNNDSIKGKKDPISMGSFNLALDKRKKQDPQFAENLVKAIKHGPSNARSITPHDENENINYFRELNDEEKEKLLQAAKPNIDEPESLQDIMERNTYTPIDPEEFRKMYGDTGDFETENERVIANIKNSNIFDNENIWGDKLEVKPEPEPEPEVQIQPEVEPEQKSPTNLIEEKGTDPEEYIRKEYEIERANLLDLNPEENQKSPNEFGIPSQGEFAPETKEEREIAKMLESETMGSETETGLSAFSSEPYEDWIARVDRVKQQLSAGDKNIDPEDRRAFQMYLNLYKEFKDTTKMAAGEKKDTPSPKAAEAVFKALDEGNHDQAHELMGHTDCPMECTTQNEGVCKHGYMSAGRTRVIFLDKDLRRASIRVADFWDDALGTVKDIAPFVAPVPYAAYELFNQPDQANQAPSTPPGYTPEIMNNIQQHVNDNKMQNLDPYQQYNKIDEDQQQRQMEQQAVQQASDYQRQMNSPANMFPKDQQSQYGK